MKVKHSILFLFLLFIALNTSAQSKKDIKNNKIASETSMITTSEDGKEVTYKDSYTVYDKNGCVTEQLDYAKDGTVKRKEINKYNSKKDKLEETIWNYKDKTYKKTSYAYDLNGLRVGEIEYDENGKTVKQCLIFYNSKGFKTEKRTYDGNKKLISTKKFNYTKF